jgi:hypothetical protein
LETVAQLRQRNKKREEIDYGDNQTPSIGQLSIINATEAMRASIIIQMYWRVVIVQL